ncbi:hypothetical protein PYCCODRAFT_296345 [Trametes coccinea BRFM310]|uniref:Uncharacterized protein n=1 Tax=Trametes coccinea (strain BRFM310) TaxID=1353009 RepID=A0A1Y2IPQ0_TRAC3|nr:hypothetical protein PYCCODRAFT_296345 [Trametes coccinea BRFM310]
MTRFVYTQMAKAKFLTATAFNALRATPCRAQWTLALSIGWAQADANWTRGGCGPLAETLRSLVLIADTAVKESPVQQISVQGQTQAQESIGISSESQAARMDATCIMIRVSVNNVKNFHRRWISRSQHAVTMLPMVSRSEQNLKAFGLW